MKVIVWSKDNCPFCVKAKTLLLFKGLTYENREIGKDWTKEQLLNDAPSAKSVPQIFIEDKYIGGYSELVEYFDGS